MDCDTGAFGYVEIEEDKLKVVYGDPSNPTIKRFCSTEYVKAIQKFAKIKAEIDSYVRDEEDSPDITLSIIKDIVRS